MSEIKLPEMTVEKRQSTTAHGLYPPKVEGEEYEQELRDVLEMVEAAKMDESWPAEILNRYNVFGEYSVADYARAANDFGFRSWRELSLFVEDDECIEMYMHICKWAKKHKLKNKVNGFINGPCLGSYKRFLERVEPVLQAGFDAKYYFYNRLETRRPIERFAEKLGFSCRNVVLGKTPHHPTFPAGHSCIFFSCLEAAKREWDIPAGLLSNLQNVVYLASMGRSGLGVHAGSDNTAGGYLAGTPECNHLGEPR